VQQRIPWLVVAFLGVAVAWLGWQNLELRRRAETREVQRRQELGELEARLEAARRVTPARLSAIERDPDAASARDAVPAAPEPEQPVVDVESWRARLAQAPDDWRYGLAVIRDLVELPPDQALAHFRELWPTMSVPHKEQSLKPFIRGGHEHALAALDLAARDEALSVQERAFGYLEEIAFADFSLDYNEYLAFADRFAGAPLAEVMSTCGREFIGRLAVLSPDEVAVVLDDLGEGDWDMAAKAGIDLRAVMRDAGGLEVIEGCLAAGSPEAARAALALARELQPDEDWMRASILPLLEAGPELGLAGSAARLFARPDCRWAVEPLLDIVARRAALRPGGRVDSNAVEVCQALASIGDARAIPAMIALIDSDNTHDTIHGVGGRGLAKLTGVSYDESHDGAWWHEWWASNQARLPAEVRGLLIPTFQ